MLGKYKNPDARKKQGLNLPEALEIAIVLVTKEVN